MIIDTAFLAGPLETFTEWQLEDALSTPDGRGLSKANKATKPQKENPFKKTFGKGQPLVPKKGYGK